MYYLVLYALTSASSSVRSRSILSKTALNCGLLLCMRLLLAMLMLSASMSICFCASLNILYPRFVRYCTFGHLHSAVSLSRGFGSFLVRYSRCFQKPLDQPVIKYARKSAPRPMADNYF